MFGGLCQRAKYDLFKYLRDRWVHLTHRPLCCVDLLEEKPIDRGRGEWYPPCQHLEEHDAQSVDIGTSIHWLSIDLFGRHVFSRSDQLVYTGERGIVLYLRRSAIEERLLAATVEQFSNTKIGEQQLVGIICSNEHILWLHVSMNDAPLVRVM